MLETNFSLAVKLKNWLKLDVVDPIPQAAVASIKKAIANGSL